MLTKTRKSSPIHAHFAAALCLFGYAACSSRTSATHDGTVQGGGAGENAGGASSGKGGSATAGSSGRGGTSSAGGEPSEGGSASGGDASGGSSGNGSGGDSAAGEGSGGEGGGGEDCTQDADGDGFGACEDCCDSLQDGCDNPARVFPGGVDFPGNGFDDDCNDAPDDEPTCDDGVAVNPPVTGFAQALEICRTTAQGETAWGLLSASLTRADGTGAPLVAQRAVRDTFGSIAARAGSRLVVLSTGVAAAPADAGFTPFEPGAEHNTASPLPADWMSANGNQLPQPPGCPNVSETPANDPILFQMRLRVPPNARAFAVDAFYLSADYPEYVCSAYTDYFVALLDSEYTGVPANRADKNVAIVTSGNTALHFNANFAYGSTGLFTACSNGGTGCLPGAMPGVHTACTSGAELAGTGFDTAVTACNSPTSVGGGTGWRKIGGNVVPGEEMVVRFAIWDTGDGSYDSVVLLDNFQWLPDNVTVGAL